MKENKSRKDGKGRGYIEYTIVAMVGTQLVVSIFIGFGVGYWLDGKFDTRPVFMLLLTFLGVAAGFINVYKVLKKAK